MRNVILSSEKELQSYIWGPRVDWKSVRKVSYLGTDLTESIKFLQSSVDDKYRRVLREEDFIPVVIKDKPFKGHLAFITLKGPVVLAEIINSPKGITWKIQEVA